MSISSGVRGAPYRDAMRRLRGVFWLVLGFSAIVNVLMLTGSIYMMQVYDRVLASGSVPTLAGLFAIVTLLYAFLGLYDFLRQRLLSRAGLRLDRAARDAAFAAGLRGGPALRDLKAVRGALSGSAVAALFDLPFAPLYLGVLYMLHPWLGSLTVAGAVVATILALFGRWRLQTALSGAQPLEAGAARIEGGARGAAGTVTALGLENRLAARWSDLHDRGLAAQQSGSDISEAVSAASRAFRMFLQSAILTLGAYLVIGGSLSAGMIIAASILSGRALAPIDQITGQIRLIGQARAAHRRLLGLVDAPPDPVVDLPDPDAYLDVIGLTCLVPGRADETEAPRILSRITFSLDPGSVLGIIGGSGSGKSTLARCLVGAGQIDAGKVKLGGAPLQQYSAASRRRLLGYLPQEVEMLHGTVRDNICQFDPDATDEDVIAAARRAGVHEMILAQPEGYGTALGTSEMPFSGGQMQRLALARAIFGEPRLVVLDEPNSNLDQAGQAALLAAISALRANGTTVVLIAHRPEILLSADQLLVLDAGTVSAFGPREEVLGTARAGHRDAAAIGADPLPLRLPASARISSSPAPAETANSADRPAVRPDRPHPETAPPRITGAAMPQRRRSS